MKEPRRASPRSAPAAPNAKRCVLSIAPNKSERNRTHIEVALAIKAAMMTVRDWVTDEVIDRSPRPHAPTGERAR